MSIVARSTESIGGTTRKLPRLDKTSNAAVAWLTNCDSDAFDHLVAICFRAKGNLFVGEPGESLKVSTRNWIRLFLLNFFSRYQSATPDEIYESAERGAFRYLGRACRLAMINEIRQAHKWQEPKTVSLNQPIESDSDQLADVLAVQPEDAGRSALGNRPPVEELEVAIVLYENRAEFRNLLGSSRLVALKAALCALLDDLPITELTKIIAKRRDVSLSQARRDFTTVRKRMQAGLQNGNRAARALFVLLNRGRPEVNIQKIRKMDKENE